MGLEVDGTANSRVEGSREPLGVGVAGEGGIVKDGLLGDVETVVGHDVGGDGFDRENRGEIGVCNAVAMLSQRRNEEFFA